MHGETVKFEGTSNFVMSVHLPVCLRPRENSAPTGRIFVKFCIWTFSENLSREFKFH